MISNEMHYNIIESLMLRCVTLCRFSRIESRSGNSSGQHLAEFVIRIKKLIAELFFHTLKIFLINLKSII